MSDVIAAATLQARRPPVRIGGIALTSPVLAAPMTGVTDLPFRRCLRRMGAAYVATEMVAGADLSEARPDVMRRAALDEEAALKVVQLVGCEAGSLARAAALADAAGADVIDLNMGCPARAVTGVLAGSALMRDLDHAERLVAAVTAATRRPVTLKMRLGWDDGMRNAAELARRAEDAGVRAFTVHGRTRSQFYAGEADWKAVAEVTSAVRVPVIVNGDVTDAESARRALALSGAAGVMMGRGLYGRPWASAATAAGLAGRGACEPGRETRFGVVLDHLRDALSFYGDALGLRTFRKHLGWYVEAAPWPADPAERRRVKAELCRLETAREVERALHRLWLEAA